MNPLATHHLEKALRANSQLELQFSCRIYSVIKIDTSSQTCEIDCRIWVQWNKLNGYENWEPEISKTFNIANALGDFYIIDAAPTKIRTKDGIKGPEVSGDKASVQAMVRSWRLQVTLAAPMNFRNFPADVQTINLKIRVPRVDEQNIGTVTAGVCKFEFSSATVRSATLPPLSGAVQTHADTSSSNNATTLTEKTTKNAIESQPEANVGIEDSWHIRNLSAEVIFTSPEKKNFKPEYHVKIVLQRRCQFYVVNIAIPIAMFVLINFAAFFLPTTDLSDRFSIILTVLLTLVAFKLSVASLLPILSYETQLDRFNVCMIMILFGTAIISAIVYKLPDGTAKVLNDTIGSVLFVIYVVTLCFCTYWLVQIYKPKMY